MILGDGRSCKGLVCFVHCRGIWLYRNLPIFLLLRFLVADGAFSDSDDDGMVEVGWLDTVTSLGMPARQSMPGRNSVLSLPPAAVVESEGSVVSPAGPSSVMPSVAHPLPSAAVAVVALKEPVAPVVPAVAPSGTNTRGGGTGWGRGGKRGRGRGRGIAGNGQNSQVREVSLAASTLDGSSATVETASSVAEADAESVASEARPRRNVAKVNYKEAKVKY